MLVWAAVLIAVSSAFAPRLHQHRGGPTTRLRSSSDDWTEHFAESEGRPYWHNARTGETTWAAPPARDAAADAWTEHYAESEGRPYWHNTRTGETTWAAPASPAPASAAPPIFPAEAPAAADDAFARRLAADTVARRRKKDDDLEALAAMMGMGGTTGATGKHVAPAADEIAELTEENRRLTARAIAQRQADQASGEFEAKSSAPKYQKGMTGYVDNKNDA